MRKYIPDEIETILIDATVADYIIQRRNELLDLFELSKMDTNPDGSRKYYYDQNDELGNEYKLINEVYQGLRW